VSAATPDLTRCDTAILANVLKHYREHVNDNLALQRLWLRLRAMARDEARPAGSFFEKDAAT
jgi:hypothetical protein